MDKDYRKKIVFMFPGNGAHYYQMGKDLFEKNNKFRSCMLELDGKVHYLTGESIISELYNPKFGKSDYFGAKLGNVATLIVEYALTQVLMEKGIYPYCVLGISLGEFMSALVAGVVNIDDVIDMWVSFINILQYKCKKGGMLAILKKTDLYYDVPIIVNGSELVTDYKTHFLISGESHSLQEIALYLKKKNIGYQHLSVDFAFHSKNIDPAADEVKKYLTTKRLRTPETHFISCTYGKELEAIYNSYFWDVIRQPIRFNETIESLEKQDDYFYLDVGPSGTLASIVNGIIINSGSNSRTFSTISPFDKNLERLEKVEMALGC